MTGLEKWDRYGCPLTFGMFDYFPETKRGLSNDATIRGMALTLGLFWTMPDGGHYLRRLPGGDVPTADDPLCGCSIGSNPAITTVTGFGPGADGSRWTYRITSVGGGGVEDNSMRGIREVVVIAAGSASIANPLPNPAIGLTVKPKADGSFVLTWKYRGKDQQAAPAEFAVFAGVGSVDFSSPIATLAYKAGLEHYTYTTAAIAGSDVEPWAFAVRARVTSTRSESNDSPGPIVPGTDTPPYGTVPTFGAAAVDTSPVSPT